MKTANSFMDLSYQNIWFVLAEITTKDFVWLEDKKEDKHISFLVMLQGDGGTPLVRVRNGPTYTHMGVASFISQNGCESTDPSGYTRTLDYVEWIRNVTGLEK
jgi:hypothetical protein